MCIPVRLQPEISSAFRHFGLQAGYEYTRKGNSPLPSSPSLGKPQTHVQICKVQWRHKHNVQTSTLQLVVARKASAIGGFSRVQHLHKHALIPSWVRSQAVCLKGSLILSRPVFFFYIVHGSLFFSLSIPLFFYSRGVLRIGHWALKGLTKEY